MKRYRVYVSDTSMLNNISAFTLIMMERSNILPNLMFSRMARMNVGVETMTYKTVMSIKLIKDLSERTRKGRLDVFIFGLHDVRIEPRCRWARTRRRN